MTYMLDTSACIELLRGNSPPDYLEGQQCEISAIVEGELWAGVHHKGGTKEEKKVRLLLDAVSVIPFDSASAQTTGKLLGHFARKGIKIGDFDTQIAAHAIQTEATLVTCNLKHFKQVPELQLKAW
ncbi:MAG: type II toxin-antitoxin system VapC family toxin [Coraliomargarita sp.]